MIESTHGGHPVGDKHPPLIVGVINISPESFYKGSVANEERGIERVIEDMYTSGAKILDVGALSSRPVQLYGGEVIGEREELERTKDLLPKLIDIATSYDLSVAMDTQSAQTAEFALKSGCSIINDISGLKNDIRMAPIISEYNVDVVLMATHNLAGDPCGIAETLKALEDSVQIAMDHGIPKEKLAIDPAFGGWQGKNPDCDLQLLRKFDQLRKLKLPVYIGVSRKSTINTLAGGTDPEDRLVGSVMLTQWLVERGAHIIRTHDVKDTVLGLRLMGNLNSL